MVDYRPAKSFSKRLREIDEKLVAEWSVNRWIITRNDQYIMTVQNKDNSFRSLDERTLKALKKCDTHRYPRIADFIREIDNHNEARERANEKELDDMSGQIAEEARQAVRKDLGMGRRIFTFG